MTRLAGRNEDRGASAVEYAILVAAIAAVIAATVFAVGLLTAGNFSDTCMAWDQAQPGGAQCAP